MLTNTGVCWGNTSSNARHKKGKLDPRNDKSSVGEEGISDVLPVGLVFAFLKAG